MTEKVYKAEIIDSKHQPWFKDSLGKTVEVVKFTHNYYRDARDKSCTYYYSNIKILD